MAWRSSLPERRSPLTVRYPLIDMRRVAAASAGLLAAALLAMPARADVVTPVPQEQRGRRQHRHRKHQRLAEFL